MDNRHPPTSARSNRSLAHGVSDRRHLASVFEMTKVVTDVAFQALADRYGMAWSSQDPKLVAGFYADDGQISLNRGDPFIGCAALSKMAADFMATFPDMVRTIQIARLSGNHGLIAWSLEGHHADTKNHVKILGWDLNIFAPLGLINTSPCWKKSSPFSSSMASSFK